MLSNIEQLLEEIENAYNINSETLWIKELHKEYAAICWQFGIKLRPVVVRLTDSRATWGRWDSTARTVEISRNLITKKSWHQVIGILKHEMAHQIVDELLGGADLHGDKFCAACNLIAVPEEFRKARISLDDPLKSWRDTQSVATHDPLLRKLEKLMSLAQSSNENEAALAMEKVHELFLKHNLEKAQTKARSDYVSLTINTKKKRVDRTQSILAGIINEHYFVRVIYSSIYDARTCENHKTIELIGSKENVLMAEYVFHFLEQTIKSLWRSYQQTAGAKIKAKSSYQIGLLTGFSTKLSHADKLKKTDNTVVALVKSIDKQLTAHVNTLYPKLTSRSRSLGYADADSYNAGCSDGARIVIHKGITTTKNSERPRMLN